MTFMTAVFAALLCILVFLVVYGILQEKYNPPKPPPPPEERPDEEWIAANPDGVWVVSKRKEGTFVRNYLGTGFIVNTNKGLDQYCHITFETLSSRHKKEFCVPEHDYDRISIGDIGILTSQGTHVNFERQARIFILNK